MKTAEEIEAKLYRLHEMLEDLHFAHIDEGRQFQIDYYVRWKRKLMQYRINILTEWGKSIAEEQQKKDIAEFKIKFEGLFHDWNEYMRPIEPRFLSEFNRLIETFNAPLPTILIQKQQ